MADDAYTVEIDEQGQLEVSTPAMRRALGTRAGRYRIVPSPPELLILERVDVAERAGGSVVLSGEIDRLGGLVDVIHFVHQSGWSGRLTIISGAARKTIYFRHGDVITAASNLPEDRIGSVLYRHGLLTVEQLDHFARQVTTEMRLGQILVEAGRITGHQLYQAVRRQIEEIFHSLLVVRRGGYYFFRHPDDAGPVSHLQLSTRELLFDGVRRIDEMAVFQEKLPGPTAVPLLRQPAPSGELPPRAQRFLTLVDGQRSIADLSRESHLGEFETTKLLYQLLQGGWIEVHWPRPGVVFRSARKSPVEHGVLIERFNEIFVGIHRAVELRGRADALQRGIESYLASVADFAPLFSGVTLGDDGRLTREQIVSNLAMAPVANKRDYLYRGLSDLLRYELFIAGEAVERAEQAEMHRRLEEILAEFPDDPSGVK